MSKALLIVDFQNDFINGSLAVPDAEATRDHIIGLATSGHYDVILLSRDWHPPNHISFDDHPQYRDYSWPPHCVQDTPGAQFDPTLLCRLYERGVRVHFVTKGADVSREAYSAFDGTLPVETETVSPYDPVDDESLTHNEPGPLGPALEQVFGVDEIDVVGLALDYCVRATALDAHAKGFKTRVLIDGTRPVAYATGADAVAELVERGVEVTR